MKVTVKVPATSANVGPAFDCAGFAVNLYNEITVERKLAKPFSSGAEGEFSGEAFKKREIRLFTDADGTLKESFDLGLVQKTKNEFFKKVVEKFTENGQNPLFLAASGGMNGQNGDFSDSVKDSDFVNVDFACEKNADFDAAGAAEGVGASDCEKAAAGRGGVSEQSSSPSNILYEKDFSDSENVDFDGASAKAFEVSAGRDVMGAGVAENSAIRGASRGDENKKLVGTVSKAVDNAGGRDVSENTPEADVVNRENAVFFDASKGGKSDFDAAARVGGCDFVPETFEITVKTNVPPARGLGSSATIIVGVLKGLNVLYGDVLTDRELAEAATAVEGHPDNVVPALFGGFVFSFAQDDGKVDFSRHNFISGVKIFALIPDFELKTSVSRGVLPKMIKYETAVYNLKQTAELFAALTKNDKALFSKALHDKLHQPYREKCIPGMSELIRQIPCAAGVLGCVLSGAGPTLAVFSEGGRIELEKIAGDVWQRSGIKFEIKELEPDNEGATVIFDE